MLLNILHCIRHPLQQRTMQPQMSVLLCLKQCNIDTFSLHVFALLGFIVQLRFPLPGSNVAAHRFKPTTFSLRNAFLDRPGKSPCADADWPSLDHSLIPKLIAVCPDWLSLVTCPTQGKRAESAPAPHIPKCNNGR